MIKSFKQFIREFFFFGTPAVFKFNFILNLERNRRKLHPTLPNKYKQQLLVNQKKKKAFLVLRMRYGGACIRR